MSEQQRESKSVTPQPPVQVDSIPWWQSVQARWAAGVIASGVVGVAHGCCKMFGLCVLKNVEVGDLAVTIFSFLGFAGGVYWFWKRIKVGQDPTNTAPPLKLK